MIFHRVLLIVVLTSCTVLSGVPGAPELKSELARIRTLQQSGKLGEARAQYTILLKSASRDDAITAAVLLDMGRIDLANGNYADSIRESDQAGSRFRRLRDL